MLRRRVAWAGWAGRVESEGGEEGKVASSQHPKSIRNEDDEGEGAAVLMGAAGVAEELPGSRLHASSAAMVLGSSIKGTPFRPPSRCV